MSLSPYELKQLAEEIAAQVVRLSRPIDDELIDVHAKAEQLGCSVPTIERMAKSGELDSVKVGRLRRYRRSAMPNKKGGHDE
jgi:excisionase family DNA binding protein